MLGKPVEWKLLWCAPPIFGNKLRLIRFLSNFLKLVPFGSVPTGKQFGFPSEAKIPLIPFAALRPSGFKTVSVVPTTLTKRPYRQSMGSPLRLPPTLLPVVGNVLPFRHQPLSQDPLLLGAVSLRLACHHLPRNPIQTLATHLSPA